MAEQGEVLQELRTRANSGELSPRQVEILAELERRLAPQAPLEPPSSGLNPLPTLEAGAQALKERFMSSLQAPSLTMDELQQGPQQNLQASLTNLKENALPELGSSIGSAVAGPLGDVAGTALGYGANLALGLEQFDPLRAAVTIGPPAVVNTLVAGAKATKALLGSTHAAKVAQDTMRKTEFEGDLAGWTAVYNQQKIRRQRATEDLRGFMQAHREGNVEKAAQYANKFVDIPTPDDIDAAYKATGDVGKLYDTPIVFDEMQSVQQKLRERAQSLAKFPGGKEAARRLEAMATAGEDQTLTLLDVKEGLAFMKGQVRDLRRSGASYASTEIKAYGELIDAVETGLKKLATDEALPDQFRVLLKHANNLYLRATTHEELTEFLTHTLLKPGPNGTLQFHPVEGLKQLEHKSNAQFKRYLQQVEGEGGQSLYDETVTFLKNMASEGVRKSEALRALSRTGGMVLPPKPTFTPGDTNPGSLALLATAATKLGLGVTTALLAGRGNYPLAGLAASSALGAPRLISELMMRPGGQRVLLTLIEAQGLEVTPSFLGFVSSAIQSQTP